MYVCNYCGEFTGKQFSRYLRHIKFVHSNEPNFTISCTQCKKTFKKFQSFRSHLQRKHYKKQHLEPNSIRDEDDHQNFVNDSDDAVDMLSENQDESPFDSGENTSMENITKFIALFVLKTKEVHMVSQPTIDSIMDNTKTLVGHCLETLSRDVKSCLAQNGLNWTDIEGLKEVFNNQVDNYEKAVDPVSTEYLHVKYVVDNLHYVVRL